MNADDRRVSKPSRDQLKRLLEPDGVGRLERVAEYVERYRQRYVFDTRTVLFDVRARAGESEAVLEGYVGVSGLREGLIESLSALGLKVRAESFKVTPLSEAALGRYALVCVPHCFLRKSAEADAEHTDELLLGEPLILTGVRRDGRHLVQCPSGYLGWVVEKDMRAVGRDTWRLWHREERVVFEGDVDLGAFAIPTGAELPVRERRVFLPDQTTVPLSSDLHTVDRSLTVQLRKKMVERAERYLGREYVWGGRGGEGLDCSGFVQMVYASVGIHLPRDTDQQHLVGRVSATPDWRDDLEPGDLLFFTGPMGNITHVALSTGGLEFIHAKGSAAVIRGSFDSKSKNYEERLDRAFLIGKRVIR